jgi:hypothetical protein
MPHEAGNEQTIICMNLSSGKKRKVERRNFFSAPTACARGNSRFAPTRINCKLLKVRRIFLCREAGNLHFGRAPDPAPVKVKYLLHL